MLLVSSLHSVSFMGAAPLTSKASLSVFMMVDEDATRDASGNILAGGAAGIVTGWQSAALSKVTDTLALTPKDDAADLYVYALNRLHAAIDLRSPH